MLVFFSGMVSLQLTIRLSFNSNLHKKISSFKNVPLETCAQARYCFFICYISDKGLAMNLGKPPSVPDAYLEVSVRDLADPVASPVRQYLQDQMLEIALVQSAIIDLQFSKPKMTPEALDLEVTRILAMLDKAWQLIETVIFLPLLSSMVRY